MVPTGRARLYSHESVLLDTRYRFASSKQVWPRATYGVLDHVGKKQSEDHGDEKREVGDLMFGDWRPGKDVEENEGTSWYTESINE